MGVDTTRPFGSPSPGCRIPASRDQVLVTGVTVHPGVPDLQACTTKVGVQGRTGALTGQPQYQVAGHGIR